ncbi:MAG: hypothetical protein JW876_11505 [Candidatus Krumholzibacteriota bacterium]|nr:hypothetical protein [Candidatus Krumholzibacteriota bacterium]
MNPFTGHLRSVYERLDLPPEARARIILEISADMEDFFRACIERGMDTAEAKRRTLEIFDLSDESLAELVDIHRSFLQRIVERLSPAVLGRWEKTVLALVVVFIALFAGRAALTEGFLREANRFVRPVLAADAAAAVAALFAAWRLFARPGGDLRRLRRGLAAVPVLGGVALAASIYGTAWELCLALDRSTAETGKSLLFLVEWLLGGSATLIAGHLSAVLAAIAWFALESRARRIERAEADALVGAAHGNEPTR